MSEGTRDEQRPPGGGLSILVSQESHKKPFCASEYGWNKAYLLVVVVAKPQEELTPSSAKAGERGTSGKSRTWWEVLVGRLSESLGQAFPVAC